MSWPIWIGVDERGEPLIGAQLVDDAKAKRRLHAQDRIYPSQLRYRICVFLPECRDLDPDHGGRPFEGLAPRPFAARPTVERKWSRGRWAIMTRSAAEEMKASGARVLGIGKQEHEFPRANRARSVRVKS